MSMSIVTHTEGSTVQHHFQAFYFTSSLSIHKQRVPSDDMVLVPIFFILTIIYLVLFNFSQYSDYILNYGWQWCLE